MNVLETILVVLEAIASVALIVVVLLQSGKEAGLSGVLSGSSDSYLSKNKNAGLDHVLYQVDRDCLDSAGPGSEPGVIRE